MKKLLVYLILGLSASCLGMQKAPEPKTPSPRKNVKQAKLHLANCIIEAINGYPNEQELQEDDLGSEFLALSPKKFIEKMRQTIQENKSFEDEEKKITITPEMIKAQLPKAQESLEAGSIEKQFYQELSSPLRKEAESVLNSSGIKATLLQADHIEEPIYAKADMIVVNPELLQKFAPTPRRRKVVWLHEGRHIKNQDSARNKALQDLLEEQKKANANSGLKSLLNPKEFSPNTKEKIQEHTRIGETFADLGATDSPNSAKAAVRLFTKEIEEKGEGMAENHAADVARLKIAQARVDLHAAQTRLSAYKRPASESCEAQRPRKSAKRALFQTDEEKDNR